MKSGFIFVLFLLLLVLAVRAIGLALALALAFAVVVVGWVYEALVPPPPKICGSPNGPPVTAPRVKLNDGRHLAYRQVGVPMEEAQHKIIVCHGHQSSKDMDLPASKELLEELKACLIVYDRAGYGESTPYPSRSVKSEAFDIQELADKLKLGTKFYVIGCSLGAYATWGCLKYIPHRLMGASLVGPIVNLWWPSIPRALSAESLRKLSPCYRWTLWIAHHTPWLIYWWRTHTSLDADGMFTDSDQRILKRLAESPNNDAVKLKQQGEYESLHRDALTAFGKWEFDPLVDLINPFPNDDDGVVHMWQGLEDLIVPLQLSRFVSEKLPWIKYHEVPGGHCIVHDAQHFEAILRALLAK